MQVHGITEFKFTPSPAVADACAVAERPSTPALFDHESPVGHSGPLTRVAVARGSDDPRARLCSSRSRNEYEVVQVR
jgi:hypothetical protein